MPNLRKIAYSPLFDRFILGVILINSVLIGIETYHPWPVLKTLEWICVAIFTVEIALKWRYAESTRAYLRDPWNTFDLIVVGAAFIPASNGIGPALRVLRVLRVLRLVKAIPELRLIVSVLGRSLVSMTYIALLMFIMFYVYAVVGVKFFGATQAEFSTLHESFFTLFRQLTLEDWTDIRYEGIASNGYWRVTIYHVTWVLLSTFVMLNLIVGAIINNYNEVQEIERRRHCAQDLSDERLLDLANELQHLVRERIAAREVERLGHHKPTD